MIDLKKLPSQPGIYPAPVYKNKIKTSLNFMPNWCGVYKFLDQQGKLLYIGKAKNLKNRIKSYFTKSADLTPAKKLMIERIKKIEFTVVSNETEALLLESTLIKKHQPPFNVELKDDKHWQYIKVTLNEAFPKVEIVRKITKNLKLKTNKKPRYFGPYTSGLAVRQTIRLIKKVFPYRTCNRDLSKLPKGRVCLQYHLGRCLGPCEKLCTKKGYDEVIKQAVDFLAGKTGDIIKDLKLKMQNSSDKKEYEKAKVYRDQIQAIEKLTVKQKVVSTKHENQDYLNIFKERNLAAAALFKVRDGKLLDQLNFTLKNAEIFSEAELLEQFVNQYYSQTTDFPKEMILPVKIDVQLKIIVPQKGAKKKLLNLAKVNAKEYFLTQLASWEKKTKETDKKLEELKKVLNLTKIPQRIEGYDISNLGGSLAVGSMAVMTNGQPDKNEYRKFKIKTIKGANDPAMIGEIIKRRLNNNWPKPDLMLIDGGPAQLNAALKQIDENNIPIVSLAKKQEKIYKPDGKLPLKLPKFSPALQLLQQLRDEAHRFAVSYHRKLRKKRLVG
ncbi:excinuclease ABC subunit UvrC [Patescibacteria group bacterium]|nr:excinuclease ABC subunit UvrC [Patescibacteria group bacterium]